MKLIRATAALALIAPMIGPRPAAAEIHRPWCVGYTATISQSCTFNSFEQCMETARGGGSCMQNPWFLHGERGPTSDAKSGGARGKRR
jgi:hypothetical protein